MSIGVSSLAVAGRSGAPAPPSTPTAALATPDERTLAVVRETGRLRVDVAVARATLAGVADPATHDDLRLALDAAEEWLTTNDPQPPGVGAEHLLDEIAVHRETLSTLVAHIGSARATPTADVTAPVTPGRTAPTRRPAPRPAVTPTPRPEAPRTPTAAPSPSAEPSPTAAPAPTTPVAPEPTTAPAPTATPGTPPSADPSPPVAEPAPDPTGGDPAPG